MWNLKRNVESFVGFFFKNSLHALPVGDLLCIYVAEFRADCLFRNRSNFLLSLEV